MNKEKANSKFIFIGVILVLVVTTAIIGGIFIFSTNSNSNQTIGNNETNENKEDEFFIPPVYKPVIYLYPTVEQEVEVELGKKERLTCTYPKYENSWKVLAKPNGDLIDLETGRNLYCLYWEGKSAGNTKIEEGFCVKKEDTVKFLEEKLAILGLTEREANEFIIYWLPRLETNEYNLIGFETMKEIEENMPLKVTPRPDTLIRVVMKFKGVNKYTEIKEQELVDQERRGYTVVEWGGTEIKN